MTGGRGTNPRPPLSRNVCDCQPLMNPRTYSSAVKSAKAAWCAPPAPRWCLAHSHMKFSSDSAHAATLAALVMNQEQTLALAQNWAAAHQGVGKAHLPAVLTGGATWSPLLVNPDDAQFLGTRAKLRQHLVARCRRCQLRGVSHSQEPAGLTAGKLGRLDSNRLASVHGDPPRTLTSTRTET